jgi:hypothetical protein
VPGRSQTPGDIGKSLRLPGLPSTMVPYDTIGDVILMVKRKSHMQDLILPDFLARVPTVSYYCPDEHRIRLRYDLTEDRDYKLVLDENDKITGDILYSGDTPETEFVYCDQHGEYFPLSTCTVGYPRSTRRADRIMRGKGISEEVDRAIIKDRIVRMLVIGGQTQAEVAARLDISQQRVSQVASEVANQIGTSSEVVRASTVDLDDIPEPTEQDLANVNLG